MIRRKKRVLFAIAAILLVGMLVTSFASFLVSRASIRTQLTDSTLPLVGDTIYSEIQRDLLQPIFISSVMASNTFVHDWVETGEQDVGSMSRYLRKIQQDYGAFTVFFVSEKSKNYYHPTGLLQRVDRADSSDAWYFRLRELAEEFEINVDEDAANKDRLAVFVNYRVVSSSGEYIGAIGVGLAIDSVVRLIESYNAAFNRVVYFVSREGRTQLGASPHGGVTDVHLVPGLGDIALDILSSKEQRVFRYDVGEGEVFLSSRFIEELDWYLMVEQREQQMLEPITQTLIFNLLLSLAIAMVVLGLAHRVLFSYQKDLENSAFLDNLTGAYNRHAFESIAELELEQGERSGQATSFLFIDIDHFKRVNDQHGHLVGDKVIRHVVDTLKSNLRASDSVCRWGGEEFCVLLRTCGESEALEVAQAVRAAVAESALSAGAAEIAVTVSVGVGQKQSTESMSACLQRVDEALYRAKNNGRNRVQLALHAAQSADEVACVHVSV